MAAFRLSTIDVLRNLDREYAERFSEVCKYVGFEEYILLDDNYGIGKEITTQSLVLLPSWGYLQYQPLFIRPLPFLP